MLYSYLKPVIRFTVSGVLTIYVRVYHRFRSEWLPGAPRQGPALALLAHFSLLDAIAAMAIDPFRPPSTLIVKEELFEVPGLGFLLRIWGAIPASRSGRDLSALRRVFLAWREGRVVGIAAQGTRSRSGRLGPINRVLVKLAVDAAGRNIPVFAAGTGDTYDALPPGAKFPRPVPIVSRVGPPIDLSRWVGRRLSEEEQEQVAAVLQGAIADLLAPERRPLPGSPALAPIASEDRAHLRDSAA